MQAILTKFISATNHNPNRIKASCAAGTITLCSDNLPFASHDERAHRIVALALQKKLGWNFPMMGGQTDGNNCCFVQFPNNFFQMTALPENTFKAVIENYYK